MVDRLEKRLNELERQVMLLRVICYVMLFIVGWFVGSMTAKGSDAADAIADRSTFPAESWPLVYYLSLESIEDPADRSDLEVALRLVVASTTRQPILERSIPEPITPTLFRIRLDRLAWPAATWRDIVARHPYARSRNPLVIRGDWLLAELSDGHASPAYYDLLFGDVRRRDAALALFDVDPDPTWRFGLIEGNSAVAVNRVRWIENRPTPRGYCWITRDVAELNRETDMLESPDGGFRHDGEEIIIGVPKIHQASGERGALQVYFLANGDGKMVGRAPVDLVVDKTRFRGLAEIRAPGSCIQCHARGINPFKTNELRSYLAAGAELDASPGVETFHLSDLEIERQRNADDFTSTVRLVTGKPAAEASAAFSRAVARYDRELDAATAAAELRTTAEELRLALAWASATGQRLTARLTGLAHGKTIPREAFAESYVDGLAILENWKAQK